MYAFEFHNLMKYKIIYLYRQFYSTSEKKENIVIAQSQNSNRNTMKLKLRIIDLLENKCILWLFIQYIKQQVGSKANQCKINLMHVLWEMTSQHAISLTFCSNAIENCIQMNVNLNFSASNPKGLFSVSYCMLNNCNSNKSIGLIWSF